jgi:hypothetical protein
MIEGPTCLRTIECVRGTDRPFPIGPHDWEGPPASCLATVGMPSIPRAVRAAIGRGWPRLALWTRRTRVHWHIDGWLRSGQIGARSGPADRAEPQPAGRSSPPGPLELRVGWPTHQQTVCPPLAHRRGRFWAGRVVFWRDGLLGCLDVGQQKTPCFQGVWPFQSGYVAI